MLIKTWLTMGESTQQTLKMLDHGNNQRAIVAVLDIPLLSYI